MKGKLLPVFRYWYSFFLQSCSGATILETLGAAVRDGGSWVESNCPICWQPAVRYCPTLLCTWQSESVTGQLLLKGVTAHAYQLVVKDALRVFMRHLTKQHSHHTVECSLYYTVYPPAGCELHSHPCLTPLLQTNCKPSSGSLLEEACQPDPWSQL